jgi:hypothetical protein
MAFHTWRKLFEAACHACGFRHTKKNCNAFGVAVLSFCPNKPPTAGCQDLKALSNIRPAFFQRIFSLSSRERAARAILPNRKENAYVSVPKSIFSEPIQPFIILPLF